ncbi:UNVERIFIED_CONTAM: hypothetical protein PYX00_003413 [Menopon gallinae]|uniref:Major facilitator superfamily (MFS) profile domain-containing protein n=1 Tax=Menopon gallinae TaxID=328185 RepID=A0AAW2I112_9NEOP
MPVSDYNASDTTGASREENDVSPNQLLLSDDRTKPTVVKTENEKARDDPFSKVRKGERSKSEIAPPAIADASARDDEEDQSATVVMPPDGGWGWVIVAASFVCNFIVDGILYSFGVFIKDVSESFSVPEARVALVGSLLSGSYLIVGPFVSALSNRYGFRIVTIFGAILAAVGFALSAVAMNVEFLSFTYGIIGGIGFGMVYSPSIIIVGFYFEKWRAMATGIAVCGSGIGTFVMAPLTEMCINKFKWQGALLVHAGILLICGLCGLLFRPLKPVKVTLEKSAESDEESKPLEETKDGNILLVKSKETSYESFRKTGSVSSLKSNKYPTAAEVLQISDGRRPRERSPTETSKMSKSTQSLNYKNVVLGYGDDMSKRQKRFSVPEFQDNMNKKMDKKKTSMSQLDESNGAAKQKRKSRTVSETLSEISSTGKRSRRNTATSVTECTVRSRRGTITQLDENINRPIYRDDIFFSGSMNRIPQYKAEGDALSYRLSVTRLPTKKDLEEEHEFRCCPEAVRRAIETMLDLSLLKSPSFMLLCASGFLTLFGFFVPFMFLTDRATTAMDRAEAVWLISTIGITNTVGRILCGVFSSFPRIDALLINNLALTVGGVSTLISGISLSVIYQYTYAVVFGFAVACFASLRSIVLVELLGLEKLTNAFGILLLFQGFAAAIGAPIAGLIKEATGNYDASFYFSGSLILISGLMLFPLRAINKWEKRKRKDDEDVQVSHVI